MTDEEEFDSVVHLNEEQVREIIEWAVSASAMVILMEAEPHHQTVDEAIERLEGHIQANTIMFENMPEVLVDPAAALAESTLANAEEEEAAVAELLDEIKDL